MRLPSPATDPSPDSASDRWTAFVNVATIVWLVLFGVSFVPSDWFNAPWVETLSIGLLSVFVMDLGVTYLPRPTTVSRVHTEALVRRAFGDSVFPHLPNSPSRPWSQGTQALSHPEGDQDCTNGTVRTWSYQGEQEGSTARALVGAGSVCMTHTVSSEPATGRYR